MNNKGLNFFIEAKAELKKVNWPSKQQTINYTLIVVGLSLAVAIFLGALDFVFSYILRYFIK
jgi:preprotein translocase subunit SecE